MIRFIVWLIIGFFSTFSICYLYYKLTNSTQKLNFKIVIFYLFGVITATLAEYYQISIVDSLFFFLYFPVMFFILNKKSFKEIIYYLVVVWSCGIIADLLSMLVLSVIYYFFKVDVNSLVYVLFPTCLVSIILLIIGNFKWLKKITDSLYNLISKIKYADFMLIVFSIFVLVSAIGLAINIRHLKIGVLLILLIVLTFLVFFLLLRTKYNEFENALFIKTLKDNNNFYIKIGQEQRIFKHNLIAKLLSVESVSNKKARMLIEDLIKQFNSNIDYSKNIKDIPYGLKGIINRKIYPYNENIDIKVTNSIDIDIFDVLKPMRYNVLIEKLNIILDNAIEACLKSHDKVLMINLYEEGDKITIEIKNSFSGILDMDNLGKINYSTKGKKRGLGLYSALRNNEVNLSVRVVNNMFQSVLSTKKQKDSELVK